MGHLALTATRWAGFGLRALRDTATVALRTRVEFGKGNFLFQTGDGILKFDFQIITQIVAALSAPARGTTTAPPAEGLLDKVVKDATTACSASEDVAEYLKWIVEATARLGTASAGARAEGGMAETVVRSAFLRIAKHLVRLPEFLEFLLGFLVAPVLVGMVLECELAVSLLDFLVRSLP